MKRILMGLLALKLCLVCVVSFADKPLDPPRGWPVPSETIQETKRLVSRNDLDVDVTITVENNEFRTGNCMTVHAAGTGGSGSYWYRFDLLSHDEITSQIMGRPYSHYNYTTTSNQQNMNYLEDDSFSYTFATPGKYTLQVYVWDIGTGAYYETPCFTQTLSVKGEDLVKKRIMEIAVEIRAEVASDYDRALLAHDRIVQMGDYDNSLALHTPDAILLRGTGVCESYAKSYYLLLRELGIPVDYVTGEANNGSDTEKHAWNAVFADGKWFLLDCTWDDPGEESGYNPKVLHYYFGLTDILMGLDHFPDRELGNTSDSLDHTYFIHQQAPVLEQWKEQLAEEIEKEISPTKTQFLVDTPSSHYAENVVNGMHNAYAEIVWPITAYALSGEFAYAGTIYNIQANYDTISKKVSVATEGIPLTESSVALDEDALIYDATEKKPDVIVTVGNSMLTQGVDYSVIYRNNVVVGVGSVIVRGLGSYTGTVIKTFEIEKANLVDATVTIDDAYYTGEATLPEIIVMIDGHTLPETDYTLSAVNNTEKGENTATLTISATNVNLVGSLTRSFSVVSPDISKATVLLDEISYTYDGIEKMPAIDSATWRGKTLTEGIDYTLSYRNNTNAGEGPDGPAVVLSGKGEYTGECVVPFTIMPVTTFRYGWQFSKKDIYYNGMIRASKG